MSFGLAPVVRIWDSDVLYNILYSFRMSPFPFDGMFDEMVLTWFLM